MGREGPRCRVADRHTCRQRTIQTTDPSGEFARRVRSSCSER
jgi:hypothetical protein